MAPWDTSCPDWIDRLKSGRSLVPDLPLFADERDRAVRVFKRLRLPDVIGTPRLGEACDEWLISIVAALFGSYDVQNNVRMIQEVFELVPKKNSKSSGAAGIMLTAAILNRRPRADLQLVAPTKKIADIAYGQIEGMILLDEELQKIFSLHRHLRTIGHRNNESSLQVMAADTDTVTGTKATFTLIDETHEFAKKKNAPNVFTEIRGALAARKDGFLVQITTQSKEPPAGVFKQELQNARDVRDGNLQLPLLPVLYEYPEEELKANTDLWKDQSTWGWVNPNLGRSLDLAFLQNELKKAERSDKSAQALLASQHFNVEIGLNLRADRWPGADFWKSCANPDLTLQELLSRSEVVVAGVDVRDGNLQLPLLPVLYEYPEEELKANTDLWKDQSTWGWVNPNLGRSLDLAFLQNELKKAERSDKSAQALLASQHFNVEIGLNLRADRWPGADFWKSCANPDLTLQELLSRSEVVVAGVDGGGLDDLFGLCILGKEAGTGKILAWFHAWAHTSVIERYPEHEQLLYDFEAAGNLTITDYRWNNQRVDEDGNETDEIASVVSVDLRQMVGYIDQCRNAGKLAQIGFDPYGVKVVVEALEDADFDRDEWMMWVSQGYKLQGTIKTYEMYLSVGTLEHDGSGLMNWCVGNARVEPKGNAVVLTKQGSDGKIDPLMALFTAGEVLATDPEPQGVVEIFAI